MLDSYKQIVGYLFKQFKISKQVFFFFFFFKKKKKQDFKEFVPPQSYLKLYKQTDNNVG